MNFKSCWTTWNLPVGLLCPEGHFCVHLSAASSKVSAPHHLIPITKIFLLVCNISHTLQCVLLALPPLPTGWTVIPCLSARSWMFIALFSAQVPVLSYGLGTGQLVLLRCCQRAPSAFFFCGMACLSLSVLFLCDSRAPASLGAGPLCQFWPDFRFWSNSHPSKYLQDLRILIPLLHETVYTQLKSANLFLCFLQPPLTPFEWDTTEMVWHVLLLTWWIWFWIAKQ